MKIFVAEVAPPRGDMALVAAGGVIGAVARYTAGLWWPTAPGNFPWTTLAINVVGSALIGVLMVLVAEVRTGRRWLRPLLGTGVLGGFTTFSSYAVDSQRLISTGHLGLAAADLGLTLAAALTAVIVTSRLTRRLVTSARR